ncbi:hypothetical protein WJX73_002302 [Symbiochloris irregularis]|uniref:Uncharacterized protein n=1 Tax=Symbiochloris irregularis TaxID=706552 RepID=A0AAW1Q064_9CHLO
MLSEAELRKVLREMRISVSDIKKGDVASLRDVLERSLAKLQGLRAHARPENALDPASMQKCEPDLEMKKAFCFNRTAEEILSMQMGGSQHDAYLQYRESLALLSHHYHETRCSQAVLQAKDESIGTLIIIKGLKQWPQGDVPLFEVQFMCNTKANFTPACQAEVQKTLGGGIPTQQFQVERLEAMLWEEICQTTWKGAVRTGVVASRPHRSALAARK